MFEDFVRLVRDLYQSEAFIPLHAPQFIGNEKAYLNDVIDSTFVSSVGPYVERFEQSIAEYTGARFAVATVNGTTALHTGLKLVGVEQGDLVLTQALSFVATANAISYCGAEPVFLDVDRHNLGLSPIALAEFLQHQTEQRAQGCFHRLSGRRIAACVPMHSLGHAADVQGLAAICEQFHVPLVEDAAEALGSWRDGCHCGSVGSLGVLSFNGNKILTTGGGGMILTNDPALARHAKHLTTTAKLPHAWRFAHDEIAYNYRMPNLNAALGLAQLQQLPHFLENKRQLAGQYRRWAATQSVTFVDEAANSRANFWLNGLLLEDEAQRDAFLSFSNDNGVMTRPLWDLLHSLPMYQHCWHDGLTNSLWLAERLVNIPSSVTPI
jgi:perosamine synthetase